MAWVIQLNGVNNHLTLNSDIVISGDFSLIVEDLIISSTTASGDFQAVTGSKSSYNNFISIRDTQWYLRINNNNYTIPFTTVKEPLTRGDLEVSRVGSTLFFNFDGDSTSFSVNTGNFNVGCFGVINVALPVSSHSLGGEIGSVTLDASNLWDTDASDHNGTTDQPILIDTAGGNDATGVNFPSFDPSVWVDLGGGTGVSGDIDFTITKPVFNVSGAATLPQPLAAIDFTVNKPVFSVEGGASLPQPVGVVDFTISKPIFSVDGSASLPNPQATISFDIAKPVFNVTGSATSPSPSGNIDFTIDKPVFAVSGGASLPQPSANISFDVNKPEFSLTGGASVPYPQATIAFNISKPVFNVNGSVTLPQPSGSVSFEISKPIFNVTGSVSGFNVPIGSIIKLEVGSNVIKLPYTSNTIKL